MSQRPILLVDAGAQRGLLQEILDRAVSCLERAAAQGAISSESARALQRDQRAVMQRLDEPFTLTVLGDFKRGKSTIVNALIGAEVAPVDVAPETLTINCYVHAETQRIYAALPNGTRALLSESELRRDALLSVIERLPHKPTHLVVERSEPSLEGLRLVDTPGLGDLDPDLTRAVQRWLPESDAVLYVISALSPLSETERHFLKMSLAPADLPKIAFVVSYIDALADPKDQERVLSAIASRLSKPFPGAPIFPVSAIAPEQPAFQALRSHIEGAMLADRDLAKISRAISGVLGALTRAKAQIGRLDAALVADESRAAEQLAQLTGEDTALKRTVAEQRASLLADISSLGGQAATLMEGFLLRLGEAFASSAPSQPYDLLRRHVPFYLSERLSEALTACVDAHQGVIEARLLAVSPGGAAAASLGLQEPSEKRTPQGIAEVGTPDTAWTLMDDLGMLIGDLLPAAAGAGLFSPTMALFGLTKGIQSSLADNAKAAALVEHVKATLPDLARSVREQVAALYREIGAAVGERYDERWRAEIEAASSAITEASALRARGQEAKDQAKAAIRSCIAEIDALLEETSAIRADIAPLGARGSP